MTRDCEYSLKTGIALINYKNITAHTLLKIMKRNYIPHNFEDAQSQDLLLCKSIEQHQKIDETIKKQSNETITEVLNELYPITFQRYRDSQCEYSILQHTEPKYKNFTNDVKILDISPSCTQPDAIKIPIAFTTYEYEKNIDYPVIVCKTGDLKITNEEINNVYNSTEQRAKLYQLASMCWKIMTPQVAFGKIHKYLEYDNYDSSIKKYLSNQLPPKKNNEERKFQCFYSFSPSQSVYEKHETTFTNKICLYWIKHKNFNRFVWRFEQRPNYNIDRDIQRYTIYNNSTQRCVAQGTRYKVYGDFPSSTDPELLQRVYGILQTIPPTINKYQFDYNNQTYTISKS